jgi:hypothetical protein
MNLTRSLLLLLIVLLSACTAAPATTTPVPVQTEVPATPSDTAAAPTETGAAVLPSETAVPAPKLPAASFEAQTYVNEMAGFALDYPAGWTVNEVVIGERGTQIQFLSAPVLAEAATVPADAARINATIYQWDPKNDLEAYLAHWKSVWQGSGFTILEEEQLVLELGLPATRFTVQTPDGQVVFLVTALEDQYLVLSGEGDLGLVNEIVQRLRPTSR